MSALSRILRDTTDNGLMFWCPGCNEAHRIQHGAGGGPRWGWNGDVEKPTFTPSVLVSGVRGLTDDEHAAYMRGEGLPEPTPFACHSFVTDGQIQFLSDCSHAMAGQTVSLPDFPRGEE
jgi:hypothetical protein